jgi:hypothetical protein
LKFRHQDTKVRVTIFNNKFGWWSYAIAIDGELTYSPGGFPSTDEAKLGAFDRVAGLLEW